MTHRWLDRLEQDKSPFLYGYEQTLFPIVQGSTYKDLSNNLQSLSPHEKLWKRHRRISVGEPAEEMYDRCGMRHTP